MKPLESARTRFERLADGRLRMTISHELVRGCPPAMVLWWFQHIGGTMEYAGSTYPRYLVWHPLDHIHWELDRAAPDGGVGAGARFRIVEAFGRNPDHYVDITDTVEKLDETGIVLVARLAGKLVSRLEHTWRQDADGTRYDSELIVGAAGPIGRFVLNPLVRSRVFSEEMGPAWLRHNVEEVGNLERFLPELYHGSHPPP